MVSQRHKTIQVSSKICEQLELSDLISGVGSFPKKPGQDSRPAPPHCQSLLTNRFASTVSTTGTSIHFGEFGLNTAGGELYRQGTKLRLQDQPLQILRILIERPG